MDNKDMIKLAKQNLSYFHNESDLAEYIAFLFSELSELDSGWKETLNFDLKDMEF